MKKVTSRAYTALLIAALVTVGLGIYLVRLVKDGGDWASFYANDSVYADGLLCVGTVTDRNDVLLAYADNGATGYSDDSVVRAANLHAVGDLEGKIGTGALAVFRPELVDYSLITGTTGEGGTIKLTVDSALNVTAYEALRGCKGAALVYNYETGEVLCMVSTPSYDPLTGFDEQDEAYSGAYINRCLSSCFTPGSIFKIVTLCAARETRPDLWDQRFECAGSITVNGQVITCTGEHGSQTIEEAFANSCNCAFAVIAGETGGDAIAAAAARFGLTSAHDLNGIPTKAGSVTSGGTDDAAVAWEGIGQYEDLVNPLAMLRLVGAIANDGVAVEPSFLYGVSAGSETLMSDATARRVGDMMAYNVQYKYGASSFPNLDIHAKSGTAELGNGLNNAWFAGYITNSGAPLAFVVLIEGASGVYGAGTAGPIANAILQQAVFG